jgi:Fe-S-cluster-containing hydrogenase component 2
MGSVCAQVALVNGLRILIDWNLCQGCEPCQARLVCKPHAILKFAPDEVADVEMERCRGCAVCLPACHFGAVKIEDLKSGRSNNELGDTID